MNLPAGVHTLQRAAIVAVALLAATPLGIAQPVESSAIATLFGNWRGAGRISYSDGSSESIRCTAYYSGGANELRMAIRCDSDKNPIDIRSRLKISGNRMSGEWEERTFNAAGTASGSVKGNSISLGIEGGAFTGSMSVSVSKSSHNVSISAQGVAMSKVTIAFSRR